MEDCIFCKIIKGKIPSAKVFEDNNSICFLDIAPANKGHCLIVPKDHYENLLEIPDEILISLMKALKKVSKALSLSVGNGAFNMIMNNGKVAGQIVSHSHIHLIPRFKNDRLRLKWTHKIYEDNELNEYKEKISKFL